MTSFASAGRSALGSFHPFLRLERLLRDHPAGDHGLAGVKGPIQLQVGDPKNAPPVFLQECLQKNAAGWGSYPPPRGTADYREAAADWLTNRFSLPSGFIDPDRNILPVPGTREGLFFTIMMAIPGPGEGDKRKVLLPSPFFHVYAGATAAAGGEPVFVPARIENGFMPDYAALPKDVLDKAALAILCSPSNPQGAIASNAQMHTLIELARTHDFLAIFDECYSEIYLDQPPPGALESAAVLGSLDNLVVFHSLSKRSSAPGLRCGFIAGDARWIDRVDGAMRFGGAGVPLPALAAGARLWRDEVHVERNRDYYRESFTMAERLLGNRLGYQRPGGGFFLWLDVGDGEAATVKLWKEAGIRVLPGAYMSAEDETGDNPGASYIRVALVYDATFNEAALRLLLDTLER